jgi:hypothetical protein
VQLCEVFNLVDWIRGRRRILHSGVLDWRLVIRLLLLLLGSVMRDGPSGHRSGDKRTAPCPSPHAHRELLPISSPEDDPAGGYAETLSAYLAVRDVRKALLRAARSGAVRVDEVLTPALHPRASPPRRRP